MSDSKIRWSSIAEPETPPANRVFMWYDDADQIFKIKRDDGSVEPLVGGSGPAGKVYTVEYFTLDSLNISSSSITLSHTPTSSSSVTLDVISGGAQMYGTDYAVSINVLSWLSGSLFGILDVGDKLRVIYTR